MCFSDVPVQFHSSDLVITGVTATAGLPAEPGGSSTFTLTVDAGSDITVKIDWGDGNGQITVSWIFIFHFFPLLDIVFVL